MCFLIFQIPNILEGYYETSSQEPGLYMMVLLGINITISKKLWIHMQYVSAFGNHSVNTAGKNDMKLI